MSFPPVNYLCRNITVLVIGTIQVIKKAHCLVYYSVGWIIFNVFALKNIVRVDNPSHTR